MSERDIIVDEDRSIGDKLPVLRRFSYEQKARAMEYVKIGVTGVFMLIILFPLFWMISTSLRPVEQISARPAPLFPSDPSLDFYRMIVFESAFLRWYANSIIYSLGVVVLTTSIATLGGYGLTRLEIPGKRNFARIILFGYMFPAILLSIPMFIFWRELGIINTYIGLILAMTAMALPFSLWLMWKFFQTVPYALEESAQMSGATRFRAFYEVALPMAKPGIIAIAVFAYASSWDQYTVPLILAPDASMWPLTLGIESYQQHTDTLWGHIMAASALTILPAFIFVYALQNYLLKGFRAGGT